MNHSNRHKTAHLHPRLCGVALAGMLLAACAYAQAPAAPQEVHWSYPYPASLQILDGYRVLYLQGNPEDLGRQHGSLMRETVQRVVEDVIVNGPAATAEGRLRLYQGTMRMEQYLPQSYRRELRALAEAAGVDYEPLVALQLFGDVDRAGLHLLGGGCSSYAAYGPATRTGELIAGRNLDYWDNGASKYGAVLICYYPEEGIPFVTVSWAGIINGWTAMNACGIIVSNNNAYGGSESLDGISTCFMLRKIAQFAASVEAGVRIIEEGPRACGTAMLVAAGEPPTAAVVEFDHEQVAVRWAEDGYVMATNGFRKLHQPQQQQYVWECSRYRSIRELIQANYGAIDRTMNFAAAAGVPISYMNLHSALLFPSDLTMAVSMGATPACEQRYRPFRFTEQGLVPLSEAGD